MIGIFDSGVGGLTVLKQLRKRLPMYDFVYFGDTARAPYGNKSKETIIKYALEDAKFLIEKGAKIIIIACNTASALSADSLKKKYPKIPIFEVISPAVDEALLLSLKKRIGIIGTKATIDSGVYKDILLKKDKEVFVFSKKCPLFVPFIEEGWIYGLELNMIANKYLKKLKKLNLDVLILGCTHYPIIKNIIYRKINKTIRIVDSATSVSRAVKSFLNRHKKINASISKTGKLDIFVSDDVEISKNIIYRILKQEVKIKKA